MQYLHFLLLSFLPGLPCHSKKKSYSVFFSLPKAVGSLICSSAMGISGKPPVQQTSRSSSLPQPLLSGSSRTNPSSLIGEAGCHPNTNCESSLGWAAGGFGTWGEPAFLAFVWCGIEKTGDSTIACTHIYIKQRHGMSKSRKWKYGMSRSRNQRQTTCSESLSHQRRQQRWYKNIRDVKKRSRRYTPHPHVLVSTCHCHDHMWLWSGC